MIRLKVILLDSGASGCMILKKHTRKLRVKTDKKSEGTWSTPAGPMTTSGTCKSRFVMNELNPNCTIEWEFNVTETLGDYDMIIRRDMLSELGNNL